MPLKRRLAMTYNSQRLMLLLKHYSFKTASFGRIMMMVKTRLQAVAADSN